MFARDLPDPLPARGRGTKASQQRHYETEGGRSGACFGHDLMQSATGETALRQASVNGGKAEREGFGSPKPLHLGQ